MRRHDHVAFAHLGKEGLHVRRQGDMGLRWRRRFTRESLNEELLNDLMLRFPALPGFSAQQFIDIWC
jgi:hypothetical protein